MRDSSNQGFFVTNKVSLYFSEDITPVSGSITIKLGSTSFLAEISNGASVTATIMKRKQNAISNVIKAELK